jgi:hypothetical protein
MEEDLPGIKYTIKAQNLKQHDTMNGWAETSK